MNNYFAGFILLFLRLGTIAFMIAFGIKIVKNMLDDMKQDTQSIHLPEIRLTRLDLPHIDPGIFSTHPLVIGRSATADLILDDPTVSSQHARITYYQQKWWIEDLGSTNLTLLNDVHIENATILVDNDIIQCGNIQLSVTINHNST